MDQNILLKFLEFVYKSKIILIKMWSVYESILRIRSTNVIE